MSERRVKISVFLGLPIIQDMITNMAIKNVLNEPCQWLVIKERLAKIKPYQVDKLNSAISSIAETLSKVHIEFSDDRQVVLDQIKFHLKPVKLKYIYEKHLGKDLTWWTYRTRKLIGNGYGYTLTEEEVLRINLAIDDIASRLRRIELVPDDIE